VSVLRRTNVTDSDLLNCGKGEAERGNCQGESTHMHSGHKTGSTFRLEVRDSIATPLTLTLQCLRSLNST
jgi:hypothetical protein